MGTPVDCYGYLASAVAGRRVSVHLTPGNETLAYSDGTTVLLPRRGTNDERDAWREVVAQALLLSGDAFSGPVLRKLIGRPQAAQRYAYLEVLRAMRLISARVPPAFERHAAFMTLDCETGSAGESANIALDMRRALPEIPEFIGSVRPLATLRNLLDSEGLAALTKKQQQGALRFNENPPPEHNDDAKAESSKILKLFENPLGGNPFSGMLGMGTSRGNNEDNPNAGDGAEMPVARIERAWRRGVNAVKAVLPFEVPDFGAAAAAPQFMYPEWDEFKQNYRRDWVHIDEVDPWRIDGQSDLAHVLTPPPRELQRQLATLGLDFEMHRRQIDGSEFDVGRLIDFAIDLKAGHTSNSVDVYRASRRTRRDLGVMVIVDVSGSTDEKNTKGESVFEHHLRAAWHLGRTLDRLGDRVALYGFRSWGRRLVHMVRLKGHEETWSGRIAERFSQLEPLGYTRTGVAIRHAHRILQTSMRLPNRLLILITDGVSYDQGYEEQYAEADTRKALAEARAEGTACICLCIGGSTSAAKLAAVFGSAGVFMVDEETQLASRIRHVCREALNTVSKRKPKHEARKAT